MIKRTTQTLHFYLFTFTVQYFYFKLHNNNVQQQQFQTVLQKESNPRSLINVILQKIHLGFKGALLYPYTMQTTCLILCYLSLL